MLLWKTRTVEMRIWPNDHCPPHVTAVCRPGCWTARFLFSMIKDDVLLWDIKPQRNAPSYDTVWQLANDVHAKRVQCREGWWKYQQHNRGICLDNAPVVGKQGEALELFDQSHAAEPDGSIVPGTGIYVPGLGIRAQIDWGDEVTSELLKEK
ncbi:MAG TPA: hypothetical protein VNE00_02960 [Paraburkholderia sp.]|jgi:hypothetical protein|nr:hypothetical protein [Paraburkholderia sp.]